MTTLAARRWDGTRHAEDDWQVGEATRCPPAVLRVCGPSEENGSEAQEERRALCLLSPGATCGGALRSEEKTRPASFVSVVSCRRPRATCGQREVFWT